MMSFPPGRAWSRLRLALLAGTIAAVAALGITAAAIAAPGGKVAQQAKDRLVVLEEEIAPTLDPDGPNGAQPQTQEIIDNLMDPLVTYNTTLENKVQVPLYKIGQLAFKPRLAQSYTKQGLVWTFHLRKGVKSCAGNELTADDVVYTFARGKSVSGASPIAWFLSNAGGVIALDPVLHPKDLKVTALHGEVTKVDPYTVQIKQFVPSELFPRVTSIFALEIFDSKEMKAHATAKDPWSHTYNLGQNAPGFGAYCLKSWTKGSEMVLTANPNYYLGQPQYKTVTIRKVPTLANRVAAIRSGSADLMYPVTPVVVQELQKTSNVDVLSWFNNNTVSIGLNYKVKPFGDPGNQYLRQAIAYALPYTDIMTQDFKGLAKQWYSLVQSRYYGYLPVTTYHTDLAKAKALLAKAGYPGGKGLEKYKDAFTMYYVTERSALLEPIANRIRTALQQIGINITFAPITSSEMNTRELTKFDLPMWIRDQLQPIGTDAGYAIQLFYVTAKVGGLLPSANYSAIDSDFLKQQKLVGAARLAILHKMQVKMMADLPLIPILEYPTWIPVRKGITNMEGRANNSVTYWWFKGP